MQHRFESFVIAHADEYERLHGEGRLEALAVGPAPLHVVRRGRIVGTLAVALGLTIFALIVYAVLVHA